MRWSEIEQAGKEKYKLSHEWHLCAADASDIEVIKVEFRKKGLQGEWLQGKENTFEGYIVNRSLEGEFE